MVKNEDESCYLAFKENNRELSLCRSTEGFSLSYPEGSFYLRISSEINAGFGFLDQDLLLVDRHMTPIAGKIVVIETQHEISLKRFQKTSNGAVLIDDHLKSLPILLSSNTQVIILGVVVFFNTRDVRERHFYANRFTEDDEKS
ncbi:MAG: S24 family peptidase [Gammaproteobacteria bacterium]|nr:S24 family peptidase [Gammaproteobacteria bacterium]MCD8542182.1 S24 family peptidase [Gammaproteobacteria bacterium]